MWQHACVHAVSLGVSKSDCFLAACTSHSAWRCQCNALFVQWLLCSWQQPRKPCGNTTSSTMCYCSSCCSSTVQVATTLCTGQPHGVLSLLFVLFGGQLIASDARHVMITGQLIWRYMMSQGGPARSSPQGWGDGEYTPLSSPAPQAVVAVVGSAHVRGMCQQWSNALQQPGQVEELLQL